MILLISGFTRIHFNNTICIKCRYFEEYVVDNVLKDERKVDKTKKELEQGEVKFKTNK